MQENQTRAAPPQSHKEEPLKIVVVYDGFSDLLRVYGTCCKLVGGLVKGIPFHTSAWNFSGLRDPELRERSARLTAEADVIIVSAGGCGELPGHVKNWISCWLPHKAGRRDALVAVLDDHPAKTAVVSGLRKYLWRTARQAGMDFFCNAERLHPNRRLEAAI